MSATDRSLLSATIALSTTTAVQALVTMAALTVSVYAPQASRDIGIAPGYIGVYASLTYIAAMLGSLVSGGFILRYGAIRFSQVAMLLCALGLFVCIGAHWWWFVLSAFIFGLGYGPTTPASSYILSRHTPSRLWSLVFSIKQTGVPLGGVLAGLAVPWLLLSFSWQGVSVIIAAMTLAGACILQIWRRRFDIDVNVSQPLVSGNVIGPLRLIFSRPGLRALALASFFFSASQQSYIYFLVTYLELGLDWSTRDAGFALSVLGLAAVAGRMFWGALADATGRSRGILGVIALAMSGAATATAAFSAASPAWGIYLVCAVFGATGAAWNGVYLAEITRSVAPQEVGHATGGGLFVTFAGVVVAPPLFGLVSEAAGGFVTGYAIMAAVTMFVAVVLLASRPVRPAGVTP